jgi:hypothetical protein
MFENEGYWRVSMVDLPLAVNLHLLSKLTPSRVLNMLRNVNMTDTVAYYIKHQVS